MVAKIFKQYLEEITEMLIKGAVPGWETAEAIIEVVEFQKRGLPHDHILVTLNRGHSITKEEIEKYCLEGIPEVLNERYYDPQRRVTNKIIHFPRGVYNPGSSCSKINGKGKKIYPMEYQSKSYFDSDGKPIY